jgi:hypothetical protein
MSDLALAEFDFKILKSGIILKDFFGRPDRRTKFYPRTGHAPFEAGGNDLII